MPVKVTIYKRVETHPGVVKKIPLRNLQVHDTFVGIGKKGVYIRSEFIKLAEELERGEVNLGADIMEL